MPTVKVLGNKLVVMIQWPTPHQIQKHPRPAVEVGYGHTWAMRKQP